MSNAGNEGHDSLTKSSLLSRLPPKPAAQIFLLFVVIGSTFIFFPTVRMILLFGGLMMSFILVSLSPALPYKLEKSEAYQGRRPIFWIGFLITVFFCLVLNAVYTIFVTKTWSGKDPSRLYFAQDWYNIVLYWIVCPVYIGCALCLVATWASNWTRLKKMADDVAARQKGERNNDTHLPNKGSSGSWRKALERFKGLLDRWNRFMLNFLSNMNEPANIKMTRLRFSLVIFMSIFMTATFISTFINDLLDSRKTPTVYWFANQIDETHRVLNEVGAYYLLMNAGLLFITCAGAFAYLAMSIEVFRFARNVEFSDCWGQIQARKQEKGVDDVGLLDKAVLEEIDNRLAHKFNEFGWAYCLAKVLLVAYAINIIIWKLSPAGKVANVDVAVMALALIGIFVIPFPRLYLEYKWHYLKYGWVKWGERYKDVRANNQLNLSVWCNRIFATLILVLLFKQFGVMDDAYGLAKFVVGIISSLGQ